MLVYSSFSSMNRFFNHFTFGRWQHAPPTMSQHSSICNIHFLPLNFNGNGYKTKQTTNLNTWWGKLGEKMAEVSHRKFRLFPCVEMFNRNRLVFLFIFPLPSGASHGNQWMPLFSSSQDWNLVIKTSISKTFDQFTYLDLWIWRENLPLLIGQCFNFFNWQSK